MGWTIIYYLFAVVWWFITLVLWIFTGGCYDKVDRFWRRRRLGDYPESCPYSNFNGGVNHW